MGFCKDRHVLRFVSCLRDKESQHNKVEDDFHARVDVVANRYHLLLSDELGHRSGFLPGIESVVKDELEYEVDGEHNDHHRKEYNDLTLHAPVAVMILLDQQSEPREQSYIAQYANGTQYTLHHLQKPV